MTFRPNQAAIDEIVASCNGDLHGASSSPNDIHRADIEDRLQVLLDLLVDNVSDLTQIARRAYTNRNDRLRV